MSLLLLALTVARAGTCPERVAPETLGPQLKAEVDAVLILDPEAPARLAAIEAALGQGCVDGPPGQGVVAGLLLAQGAADFLSAGEATPAVLQRMTWARCLGGPEAWNPVYGVDLRSHFEAAAPACAGQATLTLRFTENDLVTLDGEMFYQHGAVGVSPGRHLVQWVDDDGAWTGQWVELADGEALALGTAPPPEPVEPARPAPTLVVQIGVGAGLRRAAGLTVDHAVPFTASGRLPVVRLDGRATLGPWWLGGLVRFTPGVPIGAGETWPRVASLGGGRVLDAPIAVQLGVVASLATRPGPIVENYTPYPLLDADYTPQIGHETRLAPGLGLVARAAYGTTWRVGLDLGLHGLLEGLLLEGGPSVSWTTAPLAPWVRLDGGTLRVPGADSAFNWLNAEGGVTWSF